MDIDGNHYVNQKELGQYMNSLGRDYFDDDEGISILRSMFLEVSGESQDVFSQE